jgi:hypothetical protein
MKKWTTKAQRKERGQKFSAIDAHMEKVNIKENHPEHPTLTALALSILFPKHDKKHPRH